MTSTVHIRQASAADAVSLSRICLLTAEAGKSAEHMHDHGELPGLVYALPYIHLPCTYAFVMEDNKTQDVVGYILGALDTPAFEDAADAQWWPPLRQRYPTVADGKEGGNRTDADRRYIDILHKPHHARPGCLAFSPAHLHIDILPTYQRQGWGRRLIGQAVEHMKDKGLAGVWLEMDQRNEDARLFYERLGFLAIPDTPDTCVGIRFDHWHG